MQLQEFGVCRACGAPIRWVIGASGKRNPVDMEPVPDGNIAIDEDGVARYDSRRSPLPEGMPRYVSHFVTCPEAGRFRRERR